MLTQKHGQSWVQARVLGWRDYLVVVVEEALNPVTRAVAARTDESSACARPVLQRFSAPGEPGLVGYNGAYYDELVHLSRLASTRVSTCLRCVSNSIIFNFFMCAGNLSVERASYAGCYDIRHRRQHHTVKRQIR